MQALITLSPRALLRQLRLTQERELIVFTFNAFLNYLLGCYHYRLRYDPDHARSYLFENYGGLPGQLYDERTGLPIPSNWDERSVEILEILYRFYYEDIWMMLNHIGQFYSIHRLEVQTLSETVLIILAHGGYLLPAQPD